MELLSSENESILPMMGSSVSLYSVQYPKCSLFNFFSSKHPFRWFSQHERVNFHYIIFITIIFIQLSPLLNLPTLLRFVFLCKSQNGSTNPR